MLEYFDVTWANLAFPNRLAELSTLLHASSIFSALSALFAEIASIALCKYGTILLAPNPSIEAFKTGNRPTHYLRQPKTSFIFSQ
jgi:hypothetical protein